MTPDRPTYPAAVRHVTWWSGDLLYAGDEPARNVSVWQCEHRHPDEASALACAGEKAKAPD